MPERYEQYRDKVIGAIIDLMEAVGITFGDLEKHWEDQLRQEEEATK